jgi:hypothetical protein
MDAFSIAAPRKYTGVIKKYNMDGFKNLIRLEWMTQLALIISTEIESVSETSIQLGIKNSELIATEIMDDDSLSIRTKVAFALIAPITQSAMRMRAIIRRIPEGDLKRNLMPIMSKIGQAGMQSIHTPAHYQSAFPSIGLIGRLCIIAKQMRNEIQSIEKDVEDHKEIMEFNIATEEENQCREEVLKRFPAIVMFPGLGGILLNDELQAYHRNWSEHYFDNVVAGTNFEEGWYSLTAADMHPWINTNMVESEDELSYESIGFVMEKNEEMTLDIIWSMLVDITSFFLKRKIRIARPDNCEVKLYR